MVNEKITLSDITKRLDACRKPELDSDNFPISKIQIKEYDIRHARDVSSKVESISATGQLQPLIINKRKNVWYIVDGKTRILALKELNIKNTKVRVYVGLNEDEEDFLNANVNANVAPHTTDEKRDFIVKYYNKYDVDALCKCLGLSPEWIKKYLDTINVPEKVLDLCRPTSERGSQLNIEDASRLAKLNDHPKAQEVIAKYNKKLEDNGVTRDTKRSRLGRVSIKVREMLEDKDITKNLSEEEIAENAIEQIEKNTKFTGKYIPKNSEAKIPIFKDMISSETYDFAVCLFTEDLYRVIEETDEKIEGETKIIIDQKIIEITFVDIDPSKIFKAKEYAQSLGIVVKEHITDVLNFIQSTDKKMGKGLIYINGSPRWSFRPKFIDLIHKVYPESTIVYIVLDQLTGQSILNTEEKIEELQSVYAIRNTTSFDDVLDSMRNQLCDIGAIGFTNYATIPYKKYLGKLIPY